MSDESRTGFGKCAGTTNDSGADGKNVVDGKNVNYARKGKAASQDSQTAEWTGEGVKATWTFQNTSKEARSLNLSGLYRSL